MISSLRGTLTVKSPERIEVTVSGVGYRLLIPLSTYQALPEAGEAVTVATSMQVRENAIDLIGFASDTERELFEMLISVSGVGVKLALTVMSGLKIEDFVHSIVAEDKSVLSSISGIGPKTAGRLILELKEKIGRIAILSGVGGRERSAQVDEAILALEALGYSRFEAKRAVEAAVCDVGRTASTEVIIREALKKTA